MRPTLRFCLVVLLGLPALMATGSGTSLAQLDAGAHDPERPWAAEGDRLLADGKWKAAEQAYTRLLTGHGEDSALWTRMAWARLQQKQLSLAIEAAVKATELAPQDLDAILMLAQCEAVAGDPLAASKTLQRGLDISPDDQALMESMTSTFIALERWPEAAGLLRELIRTHPDESSYYVDLGRILLSGGDYPGAVAAFGQARALGADDAMTLALSGKAQLASGEWDQARSAFEQSISIRPNADAYGGRATVHYLEGDTEAALADFRTAVGLAPRDPDLQFNLANILVQVGDTQGAEEAYRTSLRLEPSSAEAHLNLGILLLNRFAIAEAETHLLAATDADPTLPGSWLHLARIASARFEFTDARRIYARYRGLLEEPAEQTRIDQVIAGLDRKIAKSAAAVARGEIHLLQARLESEERAREILARVRRGEDFFLLAGDASDLGERGDVDVGFMDPATANESFRAAISGLRVGELTSPIQIGEGWFLFMRVE